MGMLSDKFKKKPREDYKRVLQKIAKNHEGEAPVRLAALLEKIKSITEDIDRGR
jgi:hypothetical protein